MKLIWQTKPFLALVAFEAIGVVPGYAATVLSENFELPAVATTSQAFPSTTGSRWVSNQSFNGFRKYIWDESHTITGTEAGSTPVGSTFSTPNGTQAFTISGYNAQVGMTTKEGTLGTYTGSGTITLDFLMGRPSAFTTGPSDVFISIYAFNAATTTDADRDNQADQNPGGTAGTNWVLLGGRTQFSSTSSALEAKQFNLTLADPSTLPTDLTGWDLALRVGGGNFNYGIVDDLQLDITLIPEPSAAVLGGLGMLMLLRRRR